MNKSLIVGVILMGLGIALTTRRSKTTRNVSTLKVMRDESIPEEQPRSDKFLNRALDMRKSWSLPILLPGAIGTVLITLSVLSMATSWTITTTAPIGIVSGLLVMMAANYYLNR